MSETYLKNVIDSKSETLFKHYLKKNHSYGLTTQVTPRESIHYTLVHFVVIILLSEESDVLLVLRLLKFLFCGLSQHNHSYISITEM